MPLKNVMPIVLTLTILIACSWFYVAERRDTLTDLSKDLDTIAVIRARSVAAWRQSRLNEGYKVVRRPMVVQQMLTYLEKPNSESERWLRDVAEPLRDLEEFSDVLLLAPDRSVKWSLSGGAHPVVQEDLPFIAAAEQGKQPVLGDLQLAGTPPVPMIKTYVALHDDMGIARGVVIIVSDPGTVLYPMLSDWPGPSKSSETYLIKREGESVVLLSPLRHEKAAPLSIRLPMNDAKFTTVQAIKGGAGLLEGVDYRSVPVFSLAVEVPDSNWKLMAEVDRAEVATLWNRFTAMFSIALAALLGLLIALFRLQLRARMATHYAAIENAAAAADRMNRVYRMLSETNELIVRATSAQELLDGVARIAVERGMFRFVWIGRPQPDGKVVPVARAGEDRGYIDQINATTDPNDPHGQGPTGIVLRSGKICVTNHFLDDSITAPWHAAAMRAGVAGSAVFPIHYRDRVYGCFNLYAGEPEFFGEQEVETLSRMMADVSYALVNMDHELEQQRAEQEIHKLTERLQYYLNVSPVINYALVREGDGWAVEWVSENIERICGYTVDESQSRTWWVEHLHPEDRALAVNAWETLKAKGSLRHEYRLFRKDGSILWVADHMLAIQDETGNMIRVMGAWADITEKKLAEESLRLTEVRYRDLFDANPVPMWIYDQDSLRFLAVNDAAVAQYGYTREEFLALGLADIFPEEDVPAMLGALPLLHEGLNTTLVRRHCRKNGDVFDVEQRVHEIHYEGRKAQVASAVDVTERVRAEQALSDSAERLRLALLASGQGMWDLNLDTGEGIVDDGYVVMLGYMPGELKETFDAFRARMHPDDVGRMTEALENYLGGISDEYRVEFRQRMKDGTWKWILSVGQVVGFNEQGKPRRMLGTHTDIHARKEAEAQLRVRSASLEAAANAIFITNKDGFIQWVNPAFEALSGYSAEESQGKKPRDLIRSGKQGAEFYQQMWKTILDGKVWRGELTNRRKDGSVYSEEMTITPVEDADGEITHFVAIKQDITEQKRSFEKLQESETRFRELIEDLEVGVLLQDQDDRILLSNAAARKILGLNELNQMITRSDDARWHMVRRNGTPLPIEEVPSVRAAQTLQPVRDVVVGTTNLATGERIWILVSAVPRLNANGALMHVLVTLIDITTEMNVGEELVRSEEHLRRAVEAGHIGLWDWIPERGVFECSDEWLRMLGCERQEMSGGIEDWTSRMHPEDLRRITLFEGSGTLATFSDEYRLMHKDGKYRWFLGSFTMMRDELRSAMRVSGAHIDVTDRKELEEQFRQAQKMESIGRLAGGVAHDFNNLLSVIGGYTEMALATVPAEQPLHHDLEQVKHAADRAANLTRQLLAFSRRQVLKPEVLCINAIIRDSEKMLRRLVGEDITFKLELDETLGKTLADPGQMEQVFMNLVVNARDAMPYGGEVSISTRNAHLADGHAPGNVAVKPGNYVVVSVRDSGTGMDPSTVQRIFEPFFTTKEQGRGTGLGLATVYGIVQQSGGGIGVESQPGKGTTFDVYLPRVTEQEVEPAPADNAAPLQGKETVLLVEDEESLRELTERILRSLGYDVLAADSGAAALKIIQQPHPPVALLLSDVVMPGMSGPQLARALRALQPGLPVLYMSGYTDDAILHHGVLEKDAHLVNKPFSPVALAKALRGVLDGPELKS